MNINQTNSPTFSATFRTQNLKLEQRAVFEKVVGALTPTQEYKWAAERGVDIYFIKPTRKNGILRAIYFDQKNGTFVRGDNGRVLGTDVRSVNPKNTNCEKVTKRIQKVLRDIIMGKYKAPYWYNDPVRYGSEEEDMITKQDMVKNNN